MVKVVKNHGQGGQESWSRWSRIMVKVVKNHGQGGQESWSRWSRIMVKMVLDKEFKNLGRSGVRSQKRMF